MDHSHLKAIGYLLERTTRMVKLNYSQAFKKAGFHITPEQWVLLESLYHQGGQTQNDLAHGSFKDAPTVSRILNILEQNELLDRTTHPVDKRVRSVQLSEKGKALVKDIQPTVNDLRSQGWQDLTPEDYEEFVRIIDKIFENYASNESMN